MQSAKLLHEFLSTGDRIEFVDGNVDVDGRVYMQIASLADDRIIDRVALSKSLGLEINENFAIYDPYSDTHTRAVWRALVSISNDATIVGLQF
jgi:hypothetical protein